MKMSFKNEISGWSTWLNYLGLACVMASASATARPSHIPIPLKPKQAPGDTSVPVPVDPARCAKGDKKYIYWAAKDQVFRFPFDPNLPVYAIPDRDLSGQALRARKEIPPPRDPKEPEGCYGNPLRGLGMPYFTEFAKRVYRNLMGRPQRPSASGIYFSGRASASQTEFGTGFWPGLGVRALQDRPHCTTRASGIHMCLMNNNQDPNAFASAHVYVIPRAMLPSYAGNKDIPITVQNTLGSHKWVYAESNFKLFDNVLIRLNPEILPGEIDAMVSYLANLIRYVIDGHVPDYDWRQRR
jgi:hypothetical protein